MIRISEVEPSDLATLRAFWEIEQESVWHDRPHAIPRTWDRLVAMTSHPNTWYRRTLLVARDGDDVVGTAAMQATNRDFGYLPVERLHEMQRRDG